MKPPKNIINWTSLEILKETIAKIPQKSGIYKMIAHDKRVLYVGKAKNLPNRLKNYTDLNNLSNRIRQMVYLIKEVDYIVTENEVDALVLEASLIKSLNPPYNILLKDDKSLPFLAFSTRHPYPNIAKYRGKKQAGFKYFGPFGSGDLVGDIIETITKLFQIRTCTDADFQSRKRPCLQYQIKRCTAPCVGFISQDEYALQVKNAFNFLGNKDNTYLKNLKSQLQKLSDDLRFEEAAVIRDKIRLIQGVQNNNRLSFRDFNDTDVISIMQKADLIAVQVFFVRKGLSFGSKVFFPNFSDEDSLNDVFMAFLMQFYQDSEVPAEILVNYELEGIDLVRDALSSISGKKTSIILPKLGKKADLMAFTLPNLEEEVNKKLSEKSKKEQVLSRIKQVFNLPKIPYRIEVFDNSHFAGSDFIGGMIVADISGFVKSAYRKYNVKWEETRAGDDYAMMREVFTRRYKNHENLPDLVLIDGGKGQFSVVRDVFEKLGLLDKVPFICMSKGPDRNAGKERFYASGMEGFCFDENDPALYYLQILRDEAHRFIITAGRQKRVAKVSKSALDNLKNVGRVRKQSLLKAFGSVEGIKKASAEDISQKCKIPLGLAQQILNDLF